MLIAWLEELVYQAEATGLRFYSFRIDAVEGTRLSARATGTPEPTEPPIKGVTRHGLSLRKDDGVWRARVILDV